MVTRRILVIDDDSAQAAALGAILQRVIPQSKALHASDEKTITDYVENKFYNLAVLDLRMDHMSINGISIAERILEINPFAKILFVTRYISEFIEQLTPLLQNGNVLGFCDKNSNYEEWGKTLRALILPYYESLDANPQAVNTALVNMYSELKDEEDIYAKGTRFEDFTSMLFQSIGFTEIIKRTRDRSDNEVDLIVRNDIDDPFLSKFGKYLLIECKNHLDKIDKNDFIVFKSKLDHTNGLADIGFLITTSAFKRTVYLEALRSSEGTHKVIFIDNTEMMRLLQSDDIREELKRLIDRQVKDN